MPGLALTLGMAGGPTWTFIKFMTAAHAVIAPPAGHNNLGVTFPATPQATINDREEVAFNGYLPITAGGQRATIFWKGATGSARVVAYDEQAAPGGGILPVGGPGNFPNRRLRIGDADPGKPGATNVVSFNLILDEGAKNFRWNTTELAVKPMNSVSVFAVDVPHIDTARTTGRTFWHGRLTGLNLPFQIYNVDNVTPYVTYAQKPGPTNIMSVADRGNGVFYYDFQNGEGRFETKIGSASSFVPVQNWGDVGGLVFGAYGPTRNYGGVTPQGFSTLGYGISAMTEDSEMFGAFGAEIGVYPGLLQEAEYAPGILLYRSSSTWFGLLGTKIQRVARVGDSVPYSPASGSFATGTIVELGGNYSEMTLAGSRDLIFKAGVDTDGDSAADIEAIYVYNAGNDIGTEAPSLGLVANTGTSITGITATGQTITALDLGAKAMTNDGKAMVFGYQLSNGQRGIAKATRP